MTGSNTAQVLTSLVEAATEPRHAAGGQLKGLRPLQEALELFQRCLSLQEYQLAQSQEQNDFAMMEEPMESEPSPTEIGRAAVNDSTVSEDAWASIEQPTTADSLVDTLIAQLETLTNLCGLVVSQEGGNLGWIEEYYRALEEKIGGLANETNRTQEANLTAAKFLAAFADASYRHGQLGVLEYERELNAAFDKEGTDLKNHPQGLCDRADAELSFSASIKALTDSNTRLLQADSARVMEMRWKYITRALNDLTQASKIPHAENLPRIHLRRGDCELLRYQLGRAPNPHAIAAKSTATLVKNAEVYYRGAAGLAKNGGMTEEEHEASVKEVIAAALSGNRAGLERVVKTDEQAVSGIIEDMREEGLLSNDDIRR